MQLAEIQFRREGLRVTSAALITGAIVVVVNALFILNNLGPYLGTFHFGPLTMFSNLSEAGDNHFFLPRVQLSNDFEYVTVAEYDARRVQTPQAREFRWYLSQVDQRRLRLNMNFIRYHVSRICTSAPDASVKLTLTTVAGERIGFKNACQEPSMLRYAPVASYRPCAPMQCSAFTRAWARRGLTEQ